ncbi:MAG: cytochrome-c peroxidase [Alphaproteobacteria bacterium]|nr:cytochrome-c peroxidase [Alphaproteobacteria bacterium]
MVRQDVTRDLPVLRVFLLGIAFALAAAAAWAESRVAQPTDEIRPAGLPPPLTAEDFPILGPDDHARIELGRLLFFDKVLSGNLNIACATCHHPLAHTTDGLSLPLGEGAAGLGVTRHPGNAFTGVQNRVARNSPGLFNLGAKSVTVLFHDGRVERDPSHPAGFRSPAGDKLPPGLDSVLAVQAMFPVATADEMAGHPGENSIASAVATGDLAGENGAWTLLADRLRTIPAYVDLFMKVYPALAGPNDITFVHAANAIAGFETAAFRADNSPFDRWLRGDAFAMDAESRRGARLFYGKAGCSTCHAGPFLSDQGFHAIAMPQIGPGKGDGTGGKGDFGRRRVTDLDADRYRFRTPPLRNAALTGPWGHSGAYGSLEAVVRHHLDPVAAAANYDIGQARLPDRADLAAKDADADSSDWAGVAKANELSPIGLTDFEVADLVAFLAALTDPSSVDLSHLVPSEVPSGLPIYD